LVLVLFLARFYSHGTNYKAKEHQGCWFIKSSTIATSRDIRLHSLGLTHPDHVAKCNCLNKHVVVATRYYDEDLLP